MVHALEHRWDHHDELLRALCAMVDQLTRVCALGFSGGKAKSRLGETFDYPRPGTTKTRNSVRPRELAMQMMRG